jgi:uncharacterized metal-binding protein YceD (DUF177 family)
LRHVHPDESGENSCNPDMIDRLNNITQHEADDDEEEEIDPRWAALKNLKNNN